MSTEQVKRWRIYCNTESKNIDGFLSKTSDKPSVCFNNNGHTIDTTKTRLIETIDNNYTPCVTKWKLHCDTEDADITGYLNSDLGTPTKCFNNNTHTISGTPEKLEIINNDKRTIQEQSKPLCGNFRAETFRIDILPLETKIHDKTWPIDVAPLSVNVLSNDIHINDTLQVDISPDKICGTLTQNAAVSDTILNVSSTVMKFCEVGFYVSISDGTNIDNGGMVLEKNFINNTITISTPLIHAFLASTPTYIKLTVRMLGPHEFGITDGLVLGATKIGASFIPKNEIVRSTYINNSNNHKELYIVIEYLY